MSVLSSTQKRRRRIPNKVKLKSMGDHDEFLSRIKKTLYYGKVPLTERFSLPVSELAAELYTNVKSGRSFERLCIDETAEISRNACVSPCSLILALFYLERLKTCNPDYIDRVSPSELFVVSMMVASKFLHDDGEEDEVFNSEWANSAGIEVNEINRFEKDFLNAINWEVFVNETAFWTGLKGIEREIARREGRRRGWFSYTELLTLLDLIDAWSLAHTLVVVSVVCLTSYTASVMTLVGSAMIASQINVPGLIITSNLQQQTRLEPEQINMTKDCFNFKDNNITCFEERSMFLSDKLTLSSALPLASLSSLSMSSSWHDPGSQVQENNDSYYDMIDRFFRSHYENDYHGVDENKKSDTIANVMKMMRVSIANDRLSSPNLLINYFQKSSPSASATISTMDWLNNLLSISRSRLPSSSSSHINLPSLDVTL